MNLKLNNFITRALAGAVYVALIVGGLMMGATTFGLLCLLILLLCMDEYFKLIKRLKFKPLVNAGLIAAAISYIVVILQKILELPIKVIAIIPLALIVLMILDLFRRTRNALANIAFLGFSFLYIFFPMVLLFQIGFYNQYYWTDEFEYALPLGFFILIWTSDTGAYLAGRSMGKHKLFERISPKKTIEGSIGGLVLTIGMAYFISTFTNQVSMLDWIIIAILVVIAGTFGDLFESLFKRKADVKDSGNTIPGHGGMLDRFDSALFAAPIVFVYLTLVGI